MAKNSKNCEDEENHSHGSAEARMTKGDVVQIEGATPKYR